MIYRCDNVFNNYKIMQHIKFIQLYLSPYVHKDWQLISWGCYKSQMTDTDDPEYKIHLNAT